MQPKQEKYEHKKAICSFLLQIWTYKGLYLGVVCYGDVDHPVPGQIDHWVS
jgi:hypothetical protein